jgi:hypothetical protein
MDVRNLPAVCIATVLIVACGTTPGGEPSNPTSTTVTTVAGDELATALSRWSNAGLDTYHYVLVDDCGECDPTRAAPRTVVVWDGEILDGTRLSPTVADLFALIGAAAGDGRSVEVSYDGELGHPTEIWIDREARAYDGGTHLLITQVSPGLPGEDLSIDRLEEAKLRWEATRPAAYEYRTDILCDCELDATLWTLVDGDRVVDWRVERARDEASLDISPATIEQLLDDLHRLVSEGQVVEGGAAITGSAAYDPEFGYPTWIGLDIQIIDPTSELGTLPPRLVFVVRDVQPHDVAESAYARAVERWADVGPSDYRYELTIHDIVDASFGAPHLVIVEDEVVVSVTLDGVAVHPDTVPAYAVDDLFAQIERWEREGWDVDALYDERLGHPVLVAASRGEETIVFSIARLAPR